MYKASSGLTLALLLGGCAILGNPENKVQQALANHDYARAASIIENTSPKHAQYAVLQEQYDGVVLASETYRKTLVTEAEALGRQQRWKEAFELLETNHDKIIEPSALDELITSLEVLETRQLNKLLADRRQAQAKALLATPGLDTSLERFHAPEARAEQARLLQERLLLADDLNRLGKYYSERQQWSQARDLLRYAHELTPEQPASPQLAKAQQILNNADQQARAERNRELQEQAETLMARYQRTGQLQSLLAARAFLNQHRSNPALAAHRKRLEQWSRRRFVEEMNTGEALYARGQYNEAYRVWKQVAPLYPNDEELNKKLERSKRVLSNLKNLQQS